MHDDTDFIGWSQADRRSDVMGRNIAFLEPYYGGSHALFVDTLVAHSRHQYTLATMPARKWKWRMRGSGVHFTRQAVDWINQAPAGGFDAILCSDMLPVADFRALLPQAMRGIPIACYFHENQLTYPVNHADARDFHFAVTNVTSCLAADAVWFNSNYHRDAFLAAVRDLLKQMPDHIPQSVGDEIRAKSAVLYPPVIVPMGRRADPGVRVKESPLTIAWCHRWEYDKNPRPFFEALIKLSDSRIPFRVMMLGEQFENVPEEFASSLARLEHHIVHVGWLPGREDYLARLHEADLVVSSAIQENFGYAIIEAILAGCQPILPNRLVYPEIVGADFAPLCLYPNDDSLAEDLEATLTGGRRLTSDQLCKLQDSMVERFATSALKRLDDAIEALAQGETYS